MDDDQIRELGAKLDRIDRRIGILGRILLHITALGIGWMAYHFAKVDFGWSETLSGFVGFAGWVAVWMTIGHDFDK